MRRIALEDLDQVWQLIETLKAEGAEITFTDYPSKESLLEWIDSDSHLVYVALSEDGKFIDCVVRGRRENTPEKRHAVFMTAATRKEARGGALAAKLTAFALEDMKAHGVNLARIYVYSDNLSSLNAVKKLGFTHSGTVFRHHLDIQNGTYVDDLIFHKFLD